MCCILWYHHKKYILTECADLVAVTKKYFEEKSLYLLFRNIDLEKMFDFLREIGVLCKNLRFVVIEFVFSVLTKSCHFFLYDMIHVCCKQTVVNV